MYRFPHTPSNFIWSRHSHVLCLWMDLGFFVKTQCGPIILSLSKIKKNSLKTYTNPLLCQQDSKMTYLNDYFVMRFCLKGRALMGERIAQIEEIVKSVLRELQRGYPVLLFLSFLTSAGGALLLYPWTQTWNFREYEIHPHIFSAIWLFTCLLIYLFIYCHSVLTNVSRLPFTLVMCLCLPSVLGPKFILTSLISTAGRAYNPEVTYWVMEIISHVQDSDECFTWAIWWNSIEMTAFQPINFYKIQKAVFDPL